MSKPERAPVTNEHRKHASSVFKGLPFFCDDRELELLAQAIADAEDRVEARHLDLLLRCEAALVPYARWLLNSHHVLDDRPAIETGVLIRDIRAALEGK